MFSYTFPKCEVQAHSKYSSKLLVQIEWNKVRGMSSIYSKKIFSPSSIYNNFQQKKVFSHYKSFLLSNNLVGKPYVVMMLRTERLCDAVLSSRQKRKVCLQEMMSDYHKMADSLYT